MLRKDSAARFVEGTAWTYSGLPFSTKPVWRFTTGSKSRPVVGAELELSAYHQLMKSASAVPVSVAYDSTSKRQYWLFRDRVYWDDNGYSAQEVKALILERVTKDECKLQRAMAHAEQPEPKIAKGRRPIPEGVRIFVWKRDGGRCAKCGSRTKLEYDHIIPLSRGGSNTARNIELLCEKCNRSKGADLA